MSVGAPTMRSVSPAIAFGVYADLAYNMFSATNSAPQTTELFAGERLHSLWKYVIIADAKAVAFGLFGSILDKSLWPIAGTLTVAGIMHGLYAYAVAAGKGLAKPASAMATNNQPHARAR